MVMSGCSNNARCLHQAASLAGAAEGDGPGLSARLKKKVSRKTNFLARA